MKKYLGLFIVIAMALVVNISKVKAIENREEANVRTEARVQQVGEGEAVVRYEGSEKKIDNKENEIGLFKIEKEKIKGEIKQLREEAQNRMGVLKEKIKDEKNKAKAKIEEDRISGREQALERFDNAVKRIDDLKAKVIDQVAKMETQNIVIPATTKDLSTQADSKLITAKTKIIDINTLLAGSINELSKEDKAKIVTLTQDVQTLIKDAHQLLNDEVVALKQIIQEKIQVLRDLNGQKE